MSGGKASAAAPTDPARSPTFVRQAPARLLENKNLRLLLLRHNASRREGSLAAALVQSMALAVISTAGAYPSWVLVTNSGRQVVLGASWAISQADPPRDSPLLGPTGGPLMLAIAFCCLCSVVTGSSAIGWDFLGRRQCRALGPLLHCLTALLITCTAALGSSLLGLVRGRTRIVPELRPLGFTASPGQSLFLSFLACALASTATGLSCSSPALVAPARSSRDLGRAPRRRRLPSQTDSEESPDTSTEYFPWQDDRRVSSLDFESSDDECFGGAGWYNYLKRDLAQRPPKERLWRRQPAPRQSALPAEEGEEGRAPEQHWQPEHLPYAGILKGLALPKFLEGAIQTRKQAEGEAEHEEPRQGSAQPPRVKSMKKPPQISESQTVGAGLVQSLDKEKEDFPTAD